MKILNENIKKNFNIFYKMIQQKERLSKLAGPLSKKERFTRREDLKLKQLVAKYSTDNWKIIAEHLKPRTPRQCRERWTNYINPSLSHEPWTADEDDILTKLHYDLGNHWKELQRYLPKRSKNNIKARWHYLENLKHVDEDLFSCIKQDFNFCNQDSQNKTEITFISYEIKDFIHENDKIICKDREYPIVKRYSNFVLKTSQ